MACRYLAAPAAKVVATKEDKSFMETDSSKIVSHVAINFYTQGIPIEVPTIGVQERVRGCPCGIGTLRTLSVGTKGSD